MSQPFDLKRRSSTLLSSLILSIRFREQLIPMARMLELEPAATLPALLQKFYRLLVAIEMEARQFGLVVDSTIPDEEAPLAAVIGDNSKKAIIQNSINNWTIDRQSIERMFVEEPANLQSAGVAERYAKQIAGMLRKVTKVNANFIEITAEELLAQVANGKPAARTTRPRKAAKNKPQAENGGKQKSGGRRSVHVS
jgi:hypothetical protein